MRTAPQSVINSVAGARLNYFGAGLNRARRQGRFAPGEPGGLRPSLTPTRGSGVWRPWPSTARSRPEGRLAPSKAMGRAAWTVASGRDPSRTLGRSSRRRGAQRLEHGVGDDDELAHDGGEGDDRVL